MNGLIAYRYIDGEYQLVANGVGLVLEIEVDKVLPVKEHVARQADKLYYDGKNLHLKERWRDIVVLKVFKQLIRMERKLA